MKGIWRMHQHDGPVVDVRALELRARGRRAAIVRRADLEVDAGGTVALVGRSGSGKSTLIRSIAGLGPIAAGTVRVLGVDLAAARGARSAALRRDSMGLMLQGGNLIESLSVLHNIALPLQLTGRRDWRRRADEALGAVGLTGREDDRPSTLSGGERQRVAIARLIATAPALVLADEPTASLDSPSSDVVETALRGLAAAGSAVLFATHDLGHASRADRAIVLADGVTHPHVSASAADLGVCLRDAGLCGSGSVG